MTGPRVCGAEVHEDDASFILVYNLLFLILFVHSIS